MWRHESEGDILYDISLQTTLPELSPKLNNSSKANQALYIMMADVMSDVSPVKAAI